VKGQKDQDIIGSKRSGRNLSRPLLFQWICLPPEPILSNKTFVYKHSYKTFVSKDMFLKNLIILTIVFEVKTGKRRKCKVSRLEKRLLFY
jgi:hypothetical protein